MHVSVRSRYAETSPIKIDGGARRFASRGRSLAALLATIATIGLLLVAIWVLLKPMGRQDSGVLNAERVKTANLIGGLPEYDQEGALEMVGWLHDPSALRGPHDCVVDRGTAWISGKYGSVAAIDLSDSEGVGVIVSLTEGFDDAQTLLVLEQVLIVAATDVVALDISDPTRPRELSRLTDARLAEINGMIRWSKELVIAVSKRGWIHVLDVKDPRRPVLAASMNTRESGGLEAPHDLVRQGDHLVIVNQRRGARWKLAVYRIADGGRLREVDGWELAARLSDPGMDGANRVLASGARLFVANNYSDSLTLLDLSDPVRPSVLKHIGLADRGPDGIVIVSEFLDSLDTVWLAVGAGNSVQLLSLGIDGSIEKRGLVKFSGIAFGCHDLCMIEDRIVATGQHASAVSVIRFESAGRLNPVDDSRRSE